MRAPPAGRPTQELAGDRPEERRAPTQELDRPLLFFYTAGTFVFFLDFSGIVSEVARGRGIYVGVTIGLVYQVSTVLSLVLVL